MSLSMLDYTSITRAQDVSGEPSPLRECGHAEGWYTWIIRMSLHEGQVLVGQCLYRAGPDAPLCSCIIEQALIP